MHNWIALDADWNLLFDDTLTGATSNTEELWRHCREKYHNEGGLVSPVLHCWAFLLRSSQCAKQQDPPEG
jgi:hypothetical protein